MTFVPWKANLAPLDSQRFLRKTTQGRVPWCPEYSAGPRLITYVKMPGGAFSVSGGYQQQLWKVWTARRDNVDGLCVGKEDSLCLSLPCDGDTGMYSIAGFLVLRAAP